ncbi:MAG: c-type cytochrome [Deltaproteobacteria bacterium]|nr:c-type cytochrome [Deltaproteobacteria bacterium]
MATPQETDPIEKVSYSKWLFVLGSLFLLVSLWAYLDEFVIRRSWKRYQGEFNLLELGRLKEERKTTQQSLEQTDQQNDLLPDDQVTEENISLRRIRLRREAAEVALEGEAYRKAKKEWKERKIRHEDAKQRYGFAKADQDETFYEWKHALETGHQEEVEEQKKKYYELEERLKELKKNEMDASERLLEAQAILDQYEGELKKWQKAEEKHFEPLENIRKKIQEVRSRSFDLQQVVIDDLGKGAEVQWGTVDRCQSCHVAINRDGFENEKNPFKTHPHRTEIFASHPVEKFGCTTCHGGQGRATQIKGKPLEEHDFVHGIDKHWERPLLRGDSMQASCFKCHQDQWNLPFADVALKGKKLFWNLGCTGCHNVQGFEAAPRVGPSLQKIGSKVNEEWLVRWIKNPKDYLPHAKMPNIPLEQTGVGQTEKVAAYLLSVSQDYSFPFGRYPGGDPVMGQQLFETVGCLGCHRMGEKGTGLASDLDRIGEKSSADWIYNWVQDPKLYNPEAKMPRLHLTPQEAAHITAYLVRQGKPLERDEQIRTALHDPEKAKEGFLIVSRYGCYGCHVIQGFEKASKLSVDLSTIGRKAVYELDFGDSDVPRTWHDWIAGKLKDPQRYLTEKTSSVMPNFGLSDEEVHALVLFLSGLKKEEVPERFTMSKVRINQAKIDEGRRLVARLNCKGCHTIEGEGRLIQDYLAEGEAPPPILDGIGARVRPEFMFDFLKDPSRTKIRPWIKVRMPNFGFTDEQANAIISYFSSLNGVRPDFYSPTKPPVMSPDVRQAAEKLISRDYFSCYSCHARGGVVPPGAPAQWGPDLALVRERIRPEFIPEWLKDPQKFTPGVVMPGFLPNDESAPQEILGGSSRKQSEAIRDYLLNLSPSIHKFGDEFIHSGLVLSE